jgi:hypothetical protein
MKGSEREDPLDFSSQSVNTLDERDFHACVYL